MKKELQERVTVTKYLAEQSKLQLNQLEGLVSENKHLKARVEFLAKQTQEIDNLRDHEHLKIMRDTQYFKDKCDAALLKLKYNDQRMQELESQRKYAEDIQEREQERLRDEREAVTLRDARERREQCSLIGHFKIIGGKRNTTAF